MKLTLALIASLHGLASGALLLTFDNSSDFTGFFSSSATGSVGQAPGVGLAGGGGVNLSSLGGSAFQIWTFNTSFSPTLGSWRASVAYNNTSSVLTAPESNIFRFGITTSAAPGVDVGYATLNGGATYLPYIAMGAGNLNGGSIGVGSYNGIGSEEWGSSITTLATPFDFGWYSYELMVDYLGTNQYSATSSITKLNPDGSVSAVLATSPAQVFTNAALAGASEAFLFLSVFDGAALDNFETTAVTPIPEPSSLVGLGLGCIFSVGLRSRNRRCSQR